ncbi:non-structural maintenance of chromosome element 4 like [Tubulinosema ratisbonensis]|uniref:Non-structural maintenance of chromosomes element 4 n=1 Tax=Tubulinosema ratisbonensis TaxID=291195 RepID=A0A437ANK3_9MICR|nr:non-structural maintenance of chromosome element 4 like [Tubulinosema ratisbonensis]
MKTQKESRNIKIKYLKLLKVLRKEKQTINDKLDEVIEDTNTLLTQVDKPSELVLDAKVSYESTSQANSIFQKNCLEDRMTTEKFVNLYGSKEMKEYVNFVYNKFLGVTFAEKINLFPDEKIKHSRTQTQIKKSQKFEPKSPKKLTEAVDDENQLNLVKRIKKIVKQHEKIDYFTLVLDPKSFSRTIENLFYLSFAIKMQQVYLKMIDNNLFVTIENESEEENLNHLIVSIEYNEFKKLIKKYQLKEPMIKN